MHSDQVRTPRQRARVQAIADIKRIASEQLANQGSAALSLRAVARELGVVSSAVYRYVPSRDELLTMLIEDGYDSLGAATEQADASRKRDDLRGRWTAIGRAVRDWAVQHPPEWGLLYGGPVPGYQAPPERTVAPGSRVSLLLIALFADVAATGLPLCDHFQVPVPRPLHRDLRALRQTLGIEISDDLLSRGLLCWTALFGLVSFEMFGQYRGGIEAFDAYFDHQLSRLGTLLGLAPMPR
jgi:AcrR family transcriptional regulator